MNHVIAELQRNIRDNPENEWHVYELCKALEALHGQIFAQFSTSKKVLVIFKLAPSAHPDAIYGGIAEYESAAAARTGRMSS